MFRPRRLIWLVLFIGIGYTIWRWRQSQAPDLNVPATPTPAPPLPAREATPAGEAAGGPRRIITRVHRGAPPATQLRPAAVPPEEPPPAPSEPPAIHEQSLAPLTPEEVVSSHAEPEPPASHEQSLAPLTPEEVIDGPQEQTPAAEEPLGSAPLTPEEVADEVAPPAAGPVNINTADRQTLIDLPGIGPALADRIIAYREQYGPFGSVDALVRVQGIGPVSLNEFRHLLTV